MEELPSSDFSPEQKEIIECRIKGDSYEQIIDHILKKYDVRIYDDKVSTCLFR